VILEFFSRQKRGGDNIIIIIKNRQTFLYLVFGVVAKIYIKDLVKAFIIGFYSQIWLNLHFFYIFFLWLVILEVFICQN
jgi:hypothetical protein